MVWRESTGQHQQHQRIAGFLPRLLFLLWMALFRYCGCMRLPAEAAEDLPVVALLRVAVHFCVCSCSILYIYGNIYIIHNVFMIYILYEVICIWSICECLRDGSAAASAAVGCSGTLGCRCAAEHPVGCLTNITCVYMYI